MSLISRRTAQLPISSRSVVSASLEGDSFFAALEGYIAQCGDRPRAIVRARFGLDGSEPQTLEKIGKTYGITRERVRQIIRSVVKDIRGRKKNAILDVLCQRIVSTIESHNGILTQEALYTMFANGDSCEAGSIRFFVENFVEVEFLKEDASREASFVTKTFQKDQWRGIIKAANVIFDEQGTPMTEAELLTVLKDRTQIAQSSLLIDSLRASKMIKQNIFGLWGKTEWADIRPKGTKERVYLILKSMKKPLHFREITQLIDEYHLQKNGRKTHYQTVHNELIKDKRFVLVGRGVYALEEWGYKQGTVRQIITQILKEAKEPLNRDEVFDRLIALREVKRSTVIINLNMYFRKVGKNAYALKVA
jgi:hypothetical protein